MKQVDITKLSVVELKAMAYDCLQSIQFLQQNLNALDQEIKKKTSEIKENPDFEKVSPLRAVTSED